MVTFRMEKDYLTQGGSTFCHFGEKTSYPYVR